MSPQQISQMLDSYGITFVVAQTEFWTDLEVMANLDAVLHSEQFVEVIRIPLTSNIDIEKKLLHVYRNTHAVSATSHDLRLNLPIINRSVEGNVGRSR